jgi:hypothetical protein
MKQLALRGQRVASPKANDWRTTRKDIEDEFWKGSVYEGGL